MAELLNIVYLIAIFLVTVGGIFFLFGFTGHEEGENGINLMTILISFIVAVFLGAMIADLILFGGMLE